MYPLLYHSHHQLHLDDLSFWETLAADYGHPILELGCGTGRVLIPLAESGCTITGVDNDPEMLTYLSNILPKACKPHATLHHGDMLDFDLGAQFPLIILPCNTLSTFTSQKRKAIFTNVRRHLAPDGRFVFSMPNPEILLDLPKIGKPELEDVFPHPQSGQPVRVLSEWRRFKGADKKQRVTFKWRYEHFINEEWSDPFETATTHVLDPIEAYQSELKSADLIIIDAYGDYTGDPYLEESVYFIPVAVAAG